jgi:hypothetical protein
MVKHKIKVINEDGNTKRKKEIAKNLMKKYRLT